MEIRRVEDFLGELDLIQLNCLIANRQPYSLLMLQPGGPICGNEERVGHSDPARGSDLCRIFLQQSLHEQAELVIAPEYCTPWSVIEEIGGPDSSIRPPEGSIWVLGCETTSLCDLQRVVRGLRDEGHFVHHESILDTNIKAKSYLNPLTYVFWCSKSDGSKVLSFVIQFKTTPSRDRLDVEQRSMIVGSQVYTFNRAQDQIGLMSIICSDAFAYSEELVNESHTNMLLIHIQLNPKPAHKDFSNYRSRLQSIASRRDVELICLNWAGAIKEKKVDGREESWNNNSGSAFYFPPSKYKANESLIESAHRFGVYYSMVDHWHALYLNQEPHAILFQKQKVMIHAEPVALEPVSCIVARKRWTWGEGDIDFKESECVSDGFDQALLYYEKVASQLRELALDSPIAVERVLELLVGDPRKPEDWFQIKELSCMKVGEREAIRRVTVNQDHDPDSSGVFFRKRRLQRADDAVALPGNGVPWPAPLNGLEQGFTFGWKPSSPHTNISAEVDGSRATLIFLGDEANLNVVRSTFQAMSQALKIIAIKRDAEIERACDNLCVVYRKENKLQTYGIDKISRIDRPPESSAVDITSGED